MGRLRDLSSRWPPAIAPLPPERRFDPVPARRTLAARRAAGRNAGRILASM